MNAIGTDPAILEKICRAFRDRLPYHFPAVQEAPRDGDGLREAAYRAF